MAFKLDLGKVLSAIDMRRFNFFQTLTPEEIKAFAPPVVLRWCSIAAGADAGNALIRTNENANVDFWKISAHPELQFMLIASTGNKSRQYRDGWLGMAKSGPRTDVLSSFITDLVPGANDAEVDIILGTMDKPAFVNFVESSGILDADAKPIIAAFDRRAKERKARTTA